MTYPLPGENLTGMLDFFQYNNSILSFHGVALFGLGILVVLWAIVFSLGLKQTDTPRSALAASFITTIVAILFFIVGMVNYWPVLVCIILTAVSLVLIRTS